MKFNRKIILTNSLELHRFLIEVTNKFLFKVQKTTYPKSIHIYYQLNNNNPIFFLNQQKSYDYFYHLSIIFVSCKIIKYCGKK